MELEQSSNVGFKPARDRRPLIPQPLPVRLVAIDDVHLPVAAGWERELDVFYGGMLGFEREGSDEGILVYRAENFRLRFDVLEPPIERLDLRAVGIEVPSLSEAESKLIERQLEYQRQKGMLAGQEDLLLRDPAGNWVALREARVIV